MDVADEVGPAAEGSSGEGQEVTKSLDLEVGVVEVPQRGTDVEVATKGNGNARVSEEGCLVFQDAVVSEFFAEAMGIEGNVNGDDGGGSGGQGGVVPSGRWASGGGFEG